MGFEWMERGVYVENDGWSIQDSSEPLLKFLWWEVTLPGDTEFVATQLQTDILVPSMVSIGMVGRGGLDAQHLAEAATWVLKSASG